MDYRALQIFMLTQRAFVACACIITHYIGILFHSGLNSEQQNEQGGPDSPTPNNLSKIVIEHQWDKFPLT